MTKEQLRAFSLLYAMLRALLMANGFEMSSQFMTSINETFNEIVSKVVE